MKVKMVTIIQHFGRWAIGLAESPYWILNLGILILACLGCVLILQWEIKWIIKLLNKKKGKEAKDICSSE